MPKESVLPITAVEFDSRNPRKRTQRSSTMIRESLEHFGPLRSLVGQKLPDGRIIVRAGNGTLEEAGQIGIDKIRIIERKPDELVVVVADDLDETQWARYAIADNRSSDLSEWDTEALEEWGEELDLSEFWNEAELLNLESDALSDDEEDDDEPLNLGNADKYPLPIVLSWSEKKEWDVIKESLKTKSDKEALLKLMRGELQ